MQSSHIMVHARPANATVRRCLVDGLELETLELSGPHWQQPFAWSYETLVDRLESMGASCEWDGAWGWYPAQVPGDSMVVKVGGTAHCLDQRVMCLEVFAEWPADRFRQWAKSILDPQSSADEQLLVQLLPSGHFLTCSAYEQWLHRSECITC